MHCGVSGGNNNDSELQVVLEFPAEFYEHGTVKGARWRQGACLFQSQQRSKVRLEATSPVEERGRGIGLLQPPVFDSSAAAWEVEQGGLPIRRFDPWLF